MATQRIGLLEGREGVLVATVGVVLVTRLKELACSLFVLCRDVLRLREADAAGGRGADHE